MASAAQEAPPVVNGTGRYAEVDIASVFASKTNPRTHFDDLYIGELAGSIKEKGLIQPIVVRPRPRSGINGTFEIIAGECRFRASKIAALTRVPVIVREMTDDQVLEAQLEENIHRKDLTALEESNGYLRLIASNPTKHSAETIASRIGMSVGYVWDRLKLKDLIPEAKDILEQNRMTVGHAILIARLKLEDQKRAIAVPKGGYGDRNDKALWRADYSFNYDEQKGVARGKYDGVKACSVRELEKWIQNHVRFDIAHAAHAQPLDFTETAAQVDQAAAQPGRRKKVIPITFDHRVADDARDEERTYGKESWKRADGKGSKTCEHSALGVIVAGRGQGSTLQVCVARDRCLVHFGEVVRRKQKNDQLRAAGKPRQAARNEAKQQAREAEQRAAEEARRAAERKAWNAAVPEIGAAVAARFKAAPLQTLVQQVVRSLNLRDQDVKSAAAAMGWKRTPKNAEEWLRVMALDQALNGLDNEYWASRNFPAQAKRFGVDVAPIVKKHTPATAAAEKKATPKKAAKKR